MTAETDEQDYEARARARQRPGLRDAAARAAQDRIDWRPTDRLAATAMNAYRLRRFKQEDAA